MTFVTGVLAVFPKYYAKVNTRSKKGVFVNSVQYDPQAQQLNADIEKQSPQLLSMLSERGKGIYFPKLGILSQSADAKGKAINATIGTALEEDGSPMALPSLAKLNPLAKDKIFPYAPSPGTPALRSQWQQMLYQKNPGLQGKTFSEPVVSCALTHGLSMAGYLFCDEGDTVLTPDLYWENYELAFSRAYGAKIETFKTFSESGLFNLAELKQKFTSQAPKKWILSLNFPNNPTGYTLLEKEVKPLVEALLAAAKQGHRLVILVDDAYFGLVFEKDVYKQSLFVDLCDLHPNILAVKIDGATKEDYAWGFRVGFITFGIQGANPSVYKAMEAKAAGAIRGNISNGPNPSQSMLLATYQSESYAQEKEQKYAILKARYDKLKSILDSHPEYQQEFTALPFNSGYFMCVKPLRVDAESLRQRLLQEYSTGVIAFSGIIRVAFSSTPSSQLEQLFDNLYQACKGL